MINSTVRSRCLLLLILLAFGAAGSIQADDGWRRTAQGWEHSSTWQNPTPLPVSRPVAVAQSNPLHPGQLAILEVIASCLVLACFAPCCWRLQAPVQRPLQSAVSSRRAA